MACEVGEAYFEDMPDVEDVKGRLTDTSTKVLPTIGRAAAAKGPWILDSGASNYMVGKLNITKREVREADTTGPEVFLSTANGVVQTLPDGSDAQVKALSMDDMDMNIASMGRIVEEMLFTSVWDPKHKHLWRSPTGTWMRLAVESF
eukprot:2018605-Heterocapsa_arctica.AAC.1